MRDKVIMSWTRLVSLVASWRIRPAKRLTDPGSSAALSLVLDQQQYQAATAYFGAERRDPDREAGGAVRRFAGGDVNLAFADLAVPADLASQREQFADDQLVALDQPERPGGLTGLQHAIGMVDDDRR